MLLYGKHHTFSKAISLCNFFQSSVFFFFIDWQQCYICHVDLGRLPLMRILSSFLELKVTRVFIGLQASNFLTMISIKKRNVIRIQDQVRILQLKLLFMTT